MSVLEAMVFILHYFIFFLAVVFFLLKFHQKEKTKLLFYCAVGAWILFGFIDFFLALGRFISVFN